MSTRTLVQFADYGPAEYATFLRAKAVPEYEIVRDENGVLAGGLSVPSRFAHLLGMESAPREGGWLEMPAFLFRDQVEIVKLAIEAERFACWSDCGLGKTLIELEFARQVAARTRGRVLIITLPDVIDSIVSEALKFYGGDDVPRVLETRAEMRAWCADMDATGVAITNYEKMNPEGGPETQIVSEMKNLAGLVLDESSRLKTGGGKQKWALIKSARGIRYKLSCTATPAPNEVMEFASQAAFLERIRGENEVMWTYFTRDPATQEWTVKEHARPHFFRWMASWSIYLRDPAAYGWERRGADGRPLPKVPEPVFLEHRLRATDEQRALAFAVASAESAKGDGHGDLFVPKSLGMVGRNVLAQVARGFQYRQGTSGRSVEMVESGKPEFVAELIEREIRAGLQVLVWCVFDAEVDALIAAISDLGIPAAALGGHHSKADRRAVLAKFRAGKIPVLVSKAQLLGFGLNFQFVGSMIFNGLTDSFEAFYQAVRRAYRFGQQRQLRVHLPYIPECEEAILRNVLRKAAQFERLVREQETAYIAARAELELRAAA